MTYIDINTNICTGNDYFATIRSSMIRQIIQVHTSVRGLKEGPHDVGALELAAQLGDHESLEVLLDHVRSCEGREHESRSLLMNRGLRDLTILDHCVLGLRNAVADTDKDPTQRIRIARGRRCYVWLRERGALLGHESNGLTIWCVKLGVLKSWRNS